MRKDRKVQAGEWVIVGSSEVVCTESARYHRTIDSPIPGFGDIWGFKALTDEGVSVLVTLVGESWAIEGGRV